MTEDKKVRPQDKWDAKAGMTAKTYKVKEEVADRFKEVCKEKGLAVGIKLTELMQKFIDENNQEGQS